MAAPRGGRGWRGVGRAAAWAALAAVCLTAPLLAWAAGQPVPALLLTAQPGDFPLGPHLEVLEDESGAWTVEQVCSPPLAAGFQPWGGRCSTWGSRARPIGCASPCARRRTPRRPGRPGSGCWISAARSSIP